MSNKGGDVDEVNSSYKKPECLCTSLQHLYYLVYFYKLSGTTPILYVQFVNQILMIYLFIHHMAPYMLDECCKIHCAQCNKSTCYRHNGE